MSHVPNKLSSRSRNAQENFPIIKFSTNGSDCCHTTDLWSFVRVGKGMDDDKALATIAVDM